VAAVEHLRALLFEYPPSSPSMALFRDGKPVYMLHRGDIERREDWEIAGLLKEAFERFCAPTRV
jgi:putative YphP/YqiW family bacilliredoxin